MEDSNLSPMNLQIVTVQNKKDENLRNIKN